MQILKSMAPVLLPHLEPEAELACLPVDSLPRTPAASGAPADDAEGGVPGEVLPGDVELSVVAQPDTTSKDEAEEVPERAHPGGEGGINGAPPTDAPAPPGSAPAPAPAENAKRRLPAE